MTTKDDKITIYTAFETPSTEFIAKLLDDKFPFVSFANGNFNLDGTHEKYDKGIFSLIHACNISNDVINDWDDGENPDGLQYFIKELVKRW